jgi:hypothetical protein
MHSDAACQYCIYIVYRYTVLYYGYVVGGRRCETNTEAKAVYVDWYRLSSAAEDINLHTAFTNVFGTLTLAMAQMQVGGDDSEDDTLQGLLC